MYQSERILGLINEPLDLDPRLLILVNIQQRLPNSIASASIFLEIGTFIRRVEYMAWSELMRNELSAASDIDQLAEE